jgi:hypothetical protein
MSWMIIAGLAALAAVLFAVARAIHNWNEPEVEKEITERRKAWFDFRKARWGRIFRGRG